jgi:hypothetical protein
VKLITRIKGGLGNQLFCYAAGRRLAINNNTELVIDDISGFVRDFAYKRKYMLHTFGIKARKAKSSERFEPFSLIKRALFKRIERFKPFTNRRYIEQEMLDFDERLLHLKLKGTTYLDGLWQSEEYFKDVEKVIREDLKIIPPKDSKNIEMAKKIDQCNAIALHVRWFDMPGANTNGYNVSVEYYKKAIEYIKTKVNNPYFYLFSENPEAAKSKLSYSDRNITFVSHNKGDECAYADMWLMSKCQHIIMANSTFSWWGAWLCNNKNKIVITPEFEIAGKAAWGFKGLLPDKWICIK